MPKSIRIKRRRPTKHEPELYTPPNIGEDDDPFRILSKQLACTWTSWERIDRLIRKAARDMGIPDFYL